MLLFPILLACSFIMLIVGSVLAYFTLFVKKSSELHRQLVYSNMIGTILLFVYSLTAMPRT